MPLSDIIFKERYAHRGEDSWEDAAKRLAKAASMPENADNFEKWSTIFFEQIKNYNFLPGGRIISNAGKSKQYTMNCNVLLVEDSRESIGELLKDILVVSGTGGGVGVSFSKIRPKGAPIATMGGFSSGTISFMHCADAVASTIKTGGSRRAALMISLSVSHPDIIDFLHEKLDLKKLNNANISVEIDNKFINAVKENNDWDLIWAGKVVKTVKAREIWNIIIKNALVSGEPGILNLGLAREMNNGEYISSISTTNPCQPSYTLFLTKHQGIQPLKNLKVGDIVWTGKQWSKFSAIWSTGIKPVYRYTTSQGLYTDCTENHRIVENGIKKEIKNATFIDKTFCNEDFSGNQCSEDIAILAGLVQGDGSMQKNGGISAYLNVGEKDLKTGYERHISSFIESIKTKENFQLWKLNKSFQDLHLDYAPLPERTISDFWVSSNSKTMKAFLKGLYSANGSVLKNSSRIALKSTSKSLIKKVQIMLSTLGISSYFTTNKPKTVKWSNGNYLSRVSYDLNIAGDRLKFKNSIGFIQKYKMDSIRKDIKKTRNLKSSIREVEYLGDMEVFDYTIESSEHTVWQNGLLLSNCGELPMGPHSACCLGSVNIANFVKDKNLDRKGFEKAIEVGVRYLDNIIDINEYPLEQIKYNATSDRRIGLGLMGLHYAMLKLGIKYGSSEGVAFTEKVYEILRNHSYWTSCDLAEEKGAFQRFEAAKYLKGSFIKTLPTKIRDRIRKSGIRNVALNTQAPTGTTSIIAGVSSGIEPIFAPIYERTFWSENNKGEGIQKKEIIADELFAKFTEEGKDTSHFQGSHDISVEEHLLIQEAAQRYLDNAVSKTINLPSHYTAQDLSDMLLKYIPTLKGVTLYRDGSRGDSPLKPLSLKEYKKRKKDADDVGKMTECSSGKCEL